MKVSRLAVALLPFSLLAGACAEGNDDFGPEDVAALEALMETYRAAVVAGDVGAIMALYTADAVELPPNQASVEGFAALRTSYERQSEAEIDFQVTPTLTEGSADIGYQRGTFTSSVVLPGATEPIMDSGKYLWVAERQEDGAWRFVTVMWNSSQP